MLTPEQSGELATRISGGVHWLANRHNPMLPLDADDLYQEGMCRVLGYIHRLDEPPTDLEAWGSRMMLAANSAMIDAIRQTRWGRRNRTGIHLEPPIHLEAFTDADGEPLLGDVLVDPSVDVEAAAVRSARARDALRILARMTNRRRAEMILLHANGSSMTMIARRYGVSESRVSQIIDLGGTRTRAA